jgi:hypothetical protein
MALGEIPGGNLRAYYKLEGLTDSSGNGLTLTNNNSVAFGSGKFKDAADAGSSGTNKALTYGANIFSSLNPVDSVMMFWFKLNSTATVSNRVIINVTTKTNSPTTGMNYALLYSISGSTLTFTLSRNVQPSGAQSISINITADTEWHHVLIGFLNSSRLRITIDNKFISSSLNAASDRSNTLDPAIFLSALNTRALTAQSLAMMDELIIDENLYADDGSTPFTGPRYRYYTQAKGRFCI